MQSSSELFPVALVSAELRGDLSEDVYRLKPGNSPDFTVELAVTRLGLAGQENRGVPVILLHGSFSNRRFWYSPRGIGLGPHLARAGSPHMPLPNCGSLQSMRWGRPRSASRTIALVRGRRSPISG
mgnify:CR=1 FL=1